MLLYDTPKKLLKAICDAIRSKDGTTADINHQNIPERISSIKVGDDTSSGTAKASDILKGEIAWVDGEEITGTIESKTSNDLTINNATVSVPAGHYASAASATIPDVGSSVWSWGYPNSNGTLAVLHSFQSDGYYDGSDYRGEYQLNVQEGKTITPSTSSQIAVDEGLYTTGIVEVAGDENLISGNIKSGVSIFGVSGTYVGGGALTASIYTGSDVPDSSIGSDGDIYVEVV